MDGFAIFRAFLLLLFLVFLFFAVSFLSVPFLFTAWWRHSRRRVLFSVSSLPPPSSLTSISSQQISGVRLHDIGKMGTSPPSSAVRAGMEWQQQRFRSRREKVVDQKKSGLYFSGMSSKQSRGKDDTLEKAGKTGQSVRKHSLVEGEQKSLR